MNPGDTVESLPNTPLTTDHLDDLTESDRVELAIPIITFFDNSRGWELVHQFVLRFKTVGYVLQYADERGWVVQERAAEDEDEYGDGGESPYDGLTENLLFLAQMNDTTLPEEDSKTSPEVDSGSAMNENGTNPEGDVTTDPEGGLTFGSLMAATGDPDVDPTAPTDANRRLTCLHCGNTIEENAVTYTERFGESRWWCPIDECDGAGVGMDLLPVSRTR